MRMEGGDCPKGVSTDQCTCGVDGLRGVAGPRGAKVRRISEPP
jgi:hypothetical protein